MAELKATKRRCNDLETEVVQLRMQLDELGAAARGFEADNSQHVERSKGAERERDRIAQEFAEARKVALEREMERATLRRELEEAADAKRRLETQLQERSLEAASVTSDRDRLARLSATQKRQLQALRALSCAECRMSSYQMDGTNDFFVEDMLNKNREPRRVLK